MQPHTRDFMCRHVKIYNLNNHVINLHPYTNELFLFFIIKQHVPTFLYKLPKSFLDFVLYLPIYSP